VPGNFKLGYRFLVKHLWWKIRVVLGNFQPRYGNFQGIETRVFSPFFPLRILEKSPEVKFSSRLFLKPRGLPLFGFFPWFPKFPSLLGFRKFFNPVWKIFGPFLPLGLPKKNFPG